MAPVIFLLIGFDKNKIRSVDSMEGRAATYGTGGEQIGASEIRQVDCH